MWFGAGLLARDWWVSALIVIVFYLYHERIVFAEEEFLRRKFGEAYLRWASVTPAFMPDFKLWVPPEMEFSLKTVIRREYHSFLGIIITFSLLEAVGNFSVQGVFALDFVWSVLLGAGVLFYLIIFILDRYTSMLKVAGR